MNLSEQLAQTFRAAGLVVFGSKMEPVHDFQVVTSDYRRLQFNFNREGSVLQRVTVVKTDSEETDEQFLDEVNDFFDEQDEIFDFFQQWLREREAEDVIEE